jgi:UDP-N-acetylmuramate dehydrogenase
MGGEISQIVKKVDVITKAGDLATRSGEGIFRGYKDTVFMDNGDLITEVEIELLEGDTSETRELMKHCESDRIGKNQFAHPTCGCVFKNNYDVGVSSGILLDHAGVKELSSGEAKINPSHANFVFNHGASSRDILDLTFKMREAVFEKFGVWLEYEMEILGTMPKDLWKRFSESRPNNFNLELLEPLRESFRKNVKGNQL